MSQAGADAGGGPSESPASNDSNLSFTARIAGWTAQNRWPVLAASILVIFLAVVPSELARLAPPCRSGLGGRH